MDTQLHIHVCTYVHMQRYCRYIDISCENLCFPVDFPVNQPIEDREFHMFVLYCRQMVQSHFFQPKLWIPNQWIGFQSEHPDGFRFRFSLTKNPLRKGSIFASVGQKLVSLSWHLATMCLLVTSSYHSQENIHKKKVLWL